MICCSSVLDVDDGQTVWSEDGGKNDQKGRSKLDFADQPRAAASSAYLGSFVVHSTYSAHIDQHTSQVFEKLASYDCGAS